VGERRGREYMDKNGRVIQHDVSFRSLLFVAFLSFSPEEKE
jgi:hypothetical protein